MIILRPDSALDYIDKAQELHYLNTDTCNYLRGMYYNETQKYEKALMQFQNVMYSQSVDPKSDLGIYSRVRVASMNYYLGNLEIAMEQCIKGDSLACEVGNDEAQAAFSFYMGLCVGSTDTIRYVTYMQKAVEKADKIDKPDFITNRLRIKRHLAYAYEASRKFSDAIRITKSSLSDIEKIKAYYGDDCDKLIDYNEFYIYNTLTYSYSQLDSIDKAKDAYEKMMATEQSRTPQAKPYLPSALMSIGMPRQALKIAKEAKRDIETKLPRLTKSDEERGVKDEYDIINGSMLYRELLGTNQNYISLLEIEENCYKQIGDSAKAKRASTLQDSLLYFYNNHIKSLLSSEYAEKFDKQEYDLLLSRNNTGDGDKILIVIVIVVAQLVLFFSIVYFIRMRRRIKSGIKQKENIIPVIDISNDRKDVTQKRAMPIAYNEQQGIIVKFIDRIESEELFTNPDFTIDDYLQELNIKRTTFHRTFEEMEGTTFLRYVMAKRLEKGAELLSGEKKYKLGDIARMSGFSKTDTFTRNFTARYDITPKEYRMRALGLRD